MSKEDNGTDIDIDINISNINIDLEYNHLSTNSNHLFTFSVPTKHVNIKKNSILNTKQTELQENYKCCPVNYCQTKCCTKKCNKHCVKCSKCCKCCKCGKPCIRYELRKYNKRITRYYKNEIDTIIDDFTQLTSYHGYEIIVSEGNLKTSQAGTFIFVLLTKNGHQNKYSL